MDKLQIPNSKLQIPPNLKLQTPNSTLQTPNSKFQIIFFSPVSCLFILVSLFLFLFFHSLYQKNPQLQPQLFFCCKKSCFCQYHLIKFQYEIFKTHQEPLEMTKVFLSPNKVYRTSECRQFRNLSFHTGVDFS